MVLSFTVFSTSVAIFGSMRSVSDNAGVVSPALSDTLRIDPKIATEIEKTVKDNTITYTYKYNGYTFHIDAEVDAVQTHNAKDAIKSAWGVDVNVSDDETTMSLQ